ncbi:hypothetical protein THAOC_05745, partial [Thalassiosira oceanica]
MSPCPGVVLTAPAETPEAVVSLRRELLNRGGRGLVRRPAVVRAAGSAASTPAETAAPSESAAPATAEPAAPATAEPAQHLRELA